MTHMTYREIKTQFRERKNWMEKNDLRPTYFLTFLPEIYSKIIPFVMITEGVFVMKIEHSGEIPCRDQ